MYRGEAKLIFTCTRGAKYDPLVLQYALFTARPSWDHLTNDRNFGLNRAIPMKSWAMQVVQLCFNAQRRRILSYAQTGRMAPGTATLAVTTTSYDTDILPSPPTPSSLLTWSSSRLTSYCLGPCSTNCVWDSEPYAVDDSFVEQHIGVDMTSLVSFHLHHSMAEDTSEYCQRMTR